MNGKKVYFVTGIDTDAGKSYATGWIARNMAEEGLSVATQKLIQTGGTGISEDIVLHRRIMGTGFLPEDEAFTTCPIRFSYPASPHLAAEIDGSEIDLDLADSSTKILCSNYDTVLIEGAGGLMVPISGFYTMADFAADREYPLILVTNPVLGSINHTLMSLEICRIKGLQVDSLAFNCRPETSEVITEDTRKYLKEYLWAYFPGTKFIEIPFIDISTLPDPQMAEGTE